MGPSITRFSTNKAATIAGNWEGGVCVCEMENSERQEERVQHNRSGSERGDTQRMMDTPMLKNSNTLFTLMFVTFNIFL